MNSETTLDAACSNGLTERLAKSLHCVRWSEIDPVTRRNAQRHLLDTLGVIIAGSEQRVSQCAEATLMSVRGPGAVPVPGFKRRGDLLDATYLGAVCAHGLEFDDGYRQGSTHPGAVVVPAALAVGYQAHVCGRTLIEAIVAGYEAQIVVARLAHPAMRERGFHPTATSGVFGAAVATAKLRGTSLAVLRRALGIAASSAAGLFAFISGGADVKRLHPAHAAREGVLAVLLAENGITGPLQVLEGRDGFLQAFAGDDGLRASCDIALPPVVPYAINEAYLKPYPCCRHLHPAIEATLILFRQHGLMASEIERVEVETYRIAARHDAVGWADFASSQLSFPFVIATAMRHGDVRLEHFGERFRDNPTTEMLCRRIHVHGSSRMGERYQHQRPAHVRLYARGKVFEHDVGEPLGSSSRPLDGALIEAKFLNITEPVLGAARVRTLFRQWQVVDTQEDIASLVEATAV